MLEDPSHREIVRWSEAGDSFIVVDVRHDRSELIEFVKANNLSRLTISRKIYFPSTSSTATSLAL